MIMLLSSSSLSAIRVVSSAYLSLLIFLPAILIPACASFSPAFLMMYSVYKLNKQGDNTSLDLFLFLFGTSSNCCFLTCIQVSQKAGQVVWYSHLFQNFPQFIVIHNTEAETQWDRHTHTERHTQWDRHEHWGETHTDKDIRTEWEAQTLWDTH